MSSIYSGAGLSSGGAPRPWPSISPFRGHRRISRVNTSWRWLAGRGLKLWRVSPAQQSEKRSWPLLRQRLDSQMSSTPHWFRMWTFQEYYLPELKPICVYGKHQFHATTALREVKDAIHDAFHRRYGPVQPIDNAATTRRNKDQLISALGGDSGGGPTTTVHYFASLSSGSLHRGQGLDDD